MRPLSQGVVCDYKLTEEMVKHFIKKICSDKLVKPLHVLCVPFELLMESNAVIDVAISSGARKVYLIEEPVAAAIGANIDIEKPNGNLIVDIGGGTTDIAVLSLNGIVNKKSIKIAGDTINDAIIKYVRLSHGVCIGEKTADQINAPSAASFSLLMRMFAPVKEETDHRSALSATNQPFDAVIRGIMKERTDCHRR